MSDSVFTCIAGYEQIERCEHCNRRMKHGIKTTTHGTIGADCFHRLIKVNRNRFNGDGKPSPSMIRDYAKMMEVWSEERRNRMGYRNEHFTFELA